MPSSGEKTSLPLDSFRLACVTECGLLKVSFYYSSEGNLRERDALKIYIFIIGELGEDPSPDCSRLIHS
jgi:hypothetical protein